MNKKQKIFLAVFFSIVVVFFIFTSIYFRTLESVAEDVVSKYGYPAVFVFSILADSLEQPFGPEIFASIGLSFGLDIFAVLVVSVIGSLIGSLISYYVGKKLLYDKIQNTCHTKKYGNYCRFFSKYGGISLFLAALSPIPFVFFCWLSGAFYMRLRDFILFSVAGRTIRIAFILFIVNFFV